MKAQEKGIALVFEVEGLVPQSVLSDPSRLRQIVLNLISNAIKLPRRVACACARSSHKSAASRATR